jgi:hypothetical protein
MEKNRRASSGSLLFVLMWTVWRGISDFINESSVYQVLI